MNELLIKSLCSIASIFILIASIGILRMPDFYLRLSVTVKAATFGLGMLLIAAALYFGDFSVTSKAFSIIFFLLLTSPIAAHMIGRSAYFTGTKLWKGSKMDELKGMYNHDSHVLDSHNNNQKSSQISEKS